MSRLFLFLFLLIALGFVLQQSAADMGHVILQWHGYKVQTSAHVLFVVVLFLCFIFFFGGQLWVFLTHAPKMLANWREKTRYQQGLKTFLKGLEALDTGEQKQALKLAQKTQKLLPDTGLSHYLSGVSSHLNNQPIKAIEHYKALSNNADSQFLGLKGLIEQNKQLKNWLDVKNNAEQALLIKPKNKFVLDALFEACLKLNQFDRALQLVPNMQKYGSYTSEVLDEFESFIYLEKSKEQPEPEKIKYLQKALKAHKQNIIALEDLIGIYKQNGDIKTALKWLQNFFVHTAHHKVYALWLQIMQDEPKKYYKRRLKAFIKAHQKGFIGFWVRGQEYLKQEQYEKALECFLEAKGIQPCQQIDILIAKAANATQNKDKELTQALQSLNEDKAFVFEGEALLNAYKEWNVQYKALEPSREEQKIARPFLKMLTKS